MMRLALAVFAATVGVVLVAWAAADPGLSPVWIVVAALLLVLAGTGVVP